MYSAYMSSSPGLFLRLKLLMAYDISLVMIGGMASDVESSVVVDSELM